MNDDGRVGGGTWCGNDHVVELMEMEALQYGCR
jgi:hypothetical protein